MSRLIIIIVLGATYYTIGTAQNNAISFSSGYSYAFRPEAPGYLMELNYLRSISDRFQAGIMIGHYYNDSRGLLPKDLSTTVIPFRDYTNPLPLDGYSGGWDANAFPGIRLKSRPNRYFAFVGGAHAAYKVLQQRKSSIIFNMGAAYAFRDEMEIAYIKEATQIKLVNTSVLPDAQIPMYRYSAYRDWLIRLKASYSYLIRQNLAIHAGYSHAFFIGERDAIGSGFAGIEVKF
jgi:hypothetical protein